MPEDQSTEISGELLNDFYAECEEHLSAVRQSLRQLEAAGDTSTQAPILEKLFRSFHSLKGIIAMVGITPAEQVAHRSEDYMRALSRGQLKLSDAGTELLARASHAIEQTIIAFRDKLPFPDVKDILVLIDQFLGIPATQELLPAQLKSEGQQIPASQGTTPGISSTPLWKFTFVPSPALNEKGVNVNEIRKRLAAFGEIVQSAPKIGGGTMAFEFTVASSESPVDTADWTSLGVSFEPAKSSVTTGSAAPAQSPVTPVSASQFVRIDLHRLDDLMRVVGDLVIQRARLEDQTSRLASTVDTRGLHEVNAGFDRHFRELRETVMRLRMVPISEFFERLPFVVKDLTRGTKKKVRLETRGEQTELDKYVVEQVKNPLLHLVRNAVSHGIEDSEQRVAAGKPAEATLSLVARATGETVLIKLSDDGRGIDRRKVLARAAQMGLPVPDSTDDASILDLICMPGFSTRDEADRASGRGVGMNVVNTTLRELGGTLSMTSEEGKGTTFTLRLPLTLLITEALIVTTHEQRFAVPQGSVEEVLHIEESNVRRMDQAELVSVRGTALPLVRLRKLFGFPKSDRAMPSVLVSQTDRGRVGLVVDRIVGHRQVVVRSLRDPLVHVPGVIGATELGDGRPLLILDPMILTRQSAANVETNPVRR